MFCLKYCKSLKIVLLIARLRDKHLCFRVFLTLTGDTVSASGRRWGILARHRNVCPPKLPIAPGSSTVRQQYIASSALKIFTNYQI